MKVTVYSIKGGAGKTPIAVNLALEMGWALGTNEPDNLLEHIFADDMLLEKQAEEEFPLLPPEISCVFDLAGHISQSAAPSIVSAITQSDVVVIPIHNEGKSLLKGCQTIMQVQALGKPILIAATKLEKGKGEIFKDWTDSRDCKNIHEYIKARTGLDLPIVPLKFSKAYDRIFEDDCSLSDITANNPLLRHAFKEVADQFQVLIKTVKQFEGKTANAA